jgi:hypothetical protein
MATATNARTSRSPAATTASAVLEKSQSNMICSPLQRVRRKTGGRSLRDHRGHLRRVADWKPRGSLLEPVGDAEKRVSDLACVSAHARRTVQRGHGAEPSGWRSSRGSPPLDIARGGRQESRGQRREPLEAARPRASKTRRRRESRVGWRRARTRFLSVSRRQWALRGPAPTKPETRFSAPPTGSRSDPLGSLVRRLRQSRVGSSS